MTFFYAFLIHLRQLRCLVCCDAGVDDLLDISVHDLIQLVQGQIDSVIRHASLWEVVGTDLLRTVSGTDLASSGLCFRIVGLLQLYSRIVWHAARRTPSPYSGAGISRSGCRSRFRSGYGSDVPQSLWY